MSDRTEDLIAEGADVALRLGPLADSAFGARLLGKAPRCAVASRSASAADWGGVFALAGAGSASGGTPRHTAQTPRINTRALSASGTQGQIAKRTTTVSFPDK